MYGRPNELLKRTGSEGGKWRFRSFTRVDGRNLDHSCASVEIALELADDECVVLLAQPTAELQGDDKECNAYATGGEHAVTSDVP